MKLCAGSFELEFAEGLRVLWPATGKGDGFGIEEASDRLSVPTPLTRWMQLLKGDRNGMGSY